ncbi:IS1595 family transposase ISAlba2 [subsurface metagenome]
MKRGRAVTDIMNNTLVFGAVEVISYINRNGRYDEKTGRIRLTATQNVNENSIEQFLMQNLERGSIIRTDGWKGYSKTALAEYKHEPIPGIRASHIHRTFGEFIMVSTQNT